MPTKGVLFVCYGNSCRSIMAEALARHHWGEKARAASAGIVPIGLIMPDTLEALNERRVPAEGLFSKGFSEIDFTRIDLIVVLTGNPIEDRIPKEFSGKIVTWRVRDPYGDGLDSYRSALEAIEWLILEKLPQWMDETGEPART